MERRNRRKTRLVKLRNEEALELLLQEAYTDVCTQISDASVAINDLKNSATVTDVDDASKVAKEIGNLLKVRDLAIKTKMEISKLLATFVNLEAKGVDAVVSDEMNKVIGETAENKGALSELDMEAIRNMVDRGR